MSLDAPRALALPDLTVSESTERAPAPAPAAEITVKRSLNEVRDIIPERCYRRSTGRAAGALVQATVLYVVPVVALAVTHSWWATLLLWPLAGLGVAGLFVLGHDASHGALLESARANRVVARLCMAPSIHVEAAWDLGHNRIHHGYTTRQGFDFVWHPVTVEEYRAMSARERLRHRLEWSCLGSGAYFLRAVWWEKMWRFSAPGKRHAAIVRGKIVLGAVVVLAVGGAATLGALTGGWMSAVWSPIELFVVPFLIFVHVIGWTVYVHHVAPDIRWWTRRDWTQFHGQMESTTILRVPALVDRLWFHHIFVHVPHHVDARIPFHQLPAAAAAISAAYPDTVRSARLSLRGYLQATRTCKLYDFELGTWLPYAAARS
jgi:omega-6 fatty acid desaturase (delta-12 desaturase)